jgi:hypothetical protein
MTSGLKTNDKLKSIFRWYDSTSDAVRSGWHGNVVHDQLLVQDVRCWVFYGRGDKCHCRYKQEINSLDTFDQTQMVKIVMSRKSCSRKVSFSSAGMCRGHNHMAGI